MTGPAVVTLGESMVRLTASRPGPLAHSATMALGMGGAESNVAIGLARLGVDVAWMSRLGADSGGDLIVRELLAEGVRVAAVRDPEAPTGLMLKERRTPDTVSVTYYRSGSAASRMSSEDLDASLIASARMLHLSGITPALSSSCLEAVRTAVAIAKDAGVPISLDLNYRRRLWDENDAAAFYGSVMHDVDIVFAGDDEAAIAAGISAEPRVLAQRLHGMGAETVVIKRGSLGAFVLTDAGVHSVDALPITPIDTVGAGDAFVAGYLAEHLSGASPAEALVLAVRTGAFACLAEGDWEGAPRRAELGLLSSVDPVIR
ncbi:sugar kinase [Microbacterium awajiense]|uniref:Sugar kinase n=1 Tax=Microbacterium awajiense TaxID=415214 RepID=A0ABP7ALB2_9MICO